MSFALPLFAQEKPNTCALACLRMVLAAFGTDVDEAALATKAHLEEGGTPIDELERLARLHGLGAQVKETSVEDLRLILKEGQWPIAYVDRSVFDLRPRQRARHSIRNATIHVVVPSRVTSSAITFHDPLAPSIVRRSLRVFELAHGLLGNLSVVCSKKP